MSYNLETGKNEKYNAPHNISYENFNGFIFNNIFKLHILYFWLPCFPFYICRTIVSFPYDIAGAPCTRLSIVAQALHGGGMGWWSSYIWIEVVNISHIKNETKRVQNNTHTHTHVAAHALGPSCLRRSSQDDDKQPDKRVSLWKYSCIHRYSVPANAICSLDLLNCLFSKFSDEPDRMLGLDTGRIYADDQSTHRP